MPSSMDVEASPFFSHHIHTSFHLLRDGFIATGAHSSVEFTDLSNKHVIPGLAVWCSVAFSHKSCVANLFAFPFLLRCTRQSNLSLCGHFLLHCALWSHVTYNDSLVLFWSLFFLLVWFLVCSVVFLVWSFFWFHCIVTAYWTVYCSFSSTTFAAHHHKMEQL